METTVKKKRMLPLATSLVSILLFLILIPGPALSSNLRFPAAGGKLSDRLEATENIVTIRLVGVGSYEMTRAFQKLLERLDQVVEVKPYRFNFAPNRPRACNAEWRVKFIGNDVFALESALYHQLKELASTPDGELASLTRDLNPMEIEALGLIEPQQAGSRFLTFVQTRRLAAGRQSFHPDCNDGCCPAYPAPEIFNHGFE